MKQTAIASTSFPLQHIRTLQTMADQLRRHSLICTNKENSGHRTTAMSCAELMAGLFFHYLRFDLNNLKNPHNYCGGCTGNEKYCPKSYRTSQKSFLRMGYPSPLLLRQSAQMQ